MTDRRWPWFAAAFLVAAAPVSRAQAPGGSAPPAAGYTPEQADRGDGVFRRVCSACHTVSQFTTPAFRDGWNGRTAWELFDQIRTTMPQDNPGRLRREQYADLIAWLLKINGQAAGTTELGSTSESLRGVPIQFPTDARSP